MKVPGVFEVAPRHNERHFHRAALGRNGRAVMARPTFTFADIWTAGDEGIAGCRRRPAGPPATDGLTASCNAPAKPARSKNLLPGRKGWRPASLRSTCNRREWLDAKHPDMDHAQTHTAVTSGDIANRLDRGRNVRLHRRIGQVLRDLGGATPTPAADSRLTATTSTTSRDVPAPVDGKPCLRRSICPMGSWSNEAQTHENADRLPLLFDYATLMLEEATEQQADEYERRDGISERPMTIETNRDQASTLLRVALEDNDLGCWKDATGTRAETPWRSSPRSPSNKASPLLIGRYEGWTRMTWRELLQREWREVSVRGTTSVQPPLALAGTPPHLVFWKMSGMASPVRPSGPGWILPALHRRCFRHLLGRGHRPDPGDQSGDPWLSREPSANAAASRSTARRPAWRLGSVSIYCSALPAPTRSSRNWTPMRTPSTPAERWLFWERSIAGERAEVYENEPQSGYYAVRKFDYHVWRTGPFLPARVWWEPGQTDPDTGELLGDERCRAEIDGKEVNPWTTWTWLARRPITETEWKWLSAMSPLLPSKPPRRSRP